MLEAQFENSTIRITRYKTSIPLVTITVLKTSTRIRVQSVVNQAGTTLDCSRRTEPQTEHHATCHRQECNILIKLDD